MSRSVSGLRLSVKAAFMACTGGGQNWEPVCILVLIHLLELLTAEAGRGWLGPRCPGAASDGLARLQGSLSEDSRFAQKLLPDEWKAGWVGLMAGVLGCGSSRGWRSRLC